MEYISLYLNKSDHNILFSHWMCMISFKSYTYQLWPQIKVYYMPLQKQRFNNTTTNNNNNNNNDNNNNNNNNNDDDNI